MCMTIHSHKSVDVSGEFGDLRSEGLKKAFLAELAPLKDELSEKRERLLKAVEAAKAGLIIYVYIYNYTYMGICLLYG